jgi:hypothetical protein
MLNEDKQALIDGLAAIRCNLIVKATDTQPEIILSERDAIKDWEYNDERYVPQQGFIGQFVARTISGNLQNISDDFNIEGREIELQLGVVYGDTTNWYSFGNFLITDPTDDNVTDNTKFEAMDYTKLFNKRFDGDFTNEEFEQSLNTILGINKETGGETGDETSGETHEETGDVTALWLAKYCCAQVGVEFGSDTFTNDDFVINQNPFQAGESCRDVLKEISKLAYSWVRIGWDNKCYIDFNQHDITDADTYNVITNDHYFSLETKKEVFGPINNVVVGMSGIDGESHSSKDLASIEQYGEHTLYIYDNPLTNTFELRELAQQQANKLFGLSYTQVNVETLGHPWLQGLEKINVVDMEGNDNITYPFNKTLKYNGHIRSIIDSMGETEVESTLAYESGILKNIRNASIKVDKQNQTIEQYTSKIINIEIKDNNDYQEILDKFDNYAPKSDIVTLENSVKQIQTDTYTKTEINTKLTDGSVTKVVAVGATFDENGMTYEKTSAKTKTTINEIGVSVKDATGSTTKSLLFAGYVEPGNTEFKGYENSTIVGTDNIVVREFLVIGENSRIQDYEDGGGIFIL